MLQVEIGSGPLNLTLERVKDLSFGNQLVASLTDHLHFVISHILRARKQLEQSDFLPEIQLDKTSLALDLDQPVLVEHGILQNSDGLLVEGKRLERVEAQRVKV